MICKPYTQGQKLNVADLNEITVLIDRSETQLTEVGLNTWRKGLEGPPHSHDGKEQIFYVINGEGIIVVGRARYAIKPGCLVYVPPKVLHQTIVTGSGPLSYLLFNAFLDSSKEGHASFAEHIQQVKSIRKEQAQRGAAAVQGAEPGADTDRKGCLIEDVSQGKAYDFGANDAVLLLERNQTARSEVALVIWHAGCRGAMVAHKEKEQTFFVLSGHGKVTIGNETREVAPGHVVFVPWNTPHTTEAGAQELTYLCYNTHVTEDWDASFDDMYKRVAPGRIARWKEGRAAVGE